MKFDFYDIKFKDILDIKRLEISENLVALIGKSGGGKSTLLKIMANIISVDSGDYFFDGKNINELDPVSFRSDVTLLNQKPIIYSGNVKDNVVVGLKYQNKSIPDEEILMEMLHLFKIKCSLHNFTNCLSLGEQQRICMIRVLLMKSKVYLLDEPTSSLDKETEGVAINNFFNIAKSFGSQIIFVTHNQNLAIEYAERIIKVEGGRICEHN